MVGIWVRTVRKKGLTSPSVSVTGAGSHTTDIDSFSEAGTESRLPTPESLFLLGWEHNDREEKSYSLLKH